MFKSLLVPLTGFESDKTALDTAYLAARLFDAHIDCLWIRPKPAHFTLGALELHFVNEATAAKFLAEDELRTETARLAFAEFCDACKVTTGGATGTKKDVTANLREVIGDPVETTIAESRYHDLVVLGRAPSASHLGTSGIGSVLVESGRPVLLAFDRIPATLGTTIAIAWKNTPEATRALTVSMPLLEKAGRVLVLCAEESSSKPGEASKPAEQVAMLLRRNGVNVEARDFTLGEGFIPNVVLNVAKSSGADLLIMGAYGHHRARELVFGGFTRNVLTSAPMPVLLCH